MVTVRVTSSVILGWSGSAPPNELDLWTAPVTVTVWRRLNERGLGIFTCTSPPSTPPTTPGGCVHEFSWPTPQPPFLGWKPELSPMSAVKPLRLPSMPALPCSGNVPQPDLSIGSEQAPPGGGVAPVLSTKPMVPTTGFAGRPTSRLLPGTSASHRPSTRLYSM